VLVPYFLSRVLVVGTLVVSRLVMDATDAAERYRVQASLLGWDAAWYRDIARGGYDAVAQEGLRFFPLFPLLARVVSWVPGVNAGVAVVLVANACAVAMGFAIRELAMQERGDENLGRRAVWLAFLAPPAFVLVMGYAEALFMTAAAMTLLGLRRRRWAMAALAALIASLTRPLGILLAVPAIVEALRTRDRAAIVPVLAPVAGTLAYLAWAQDRTNELLYPLRVQQDATRRGGWLDPFRATGHAAREFVSGGHVSAGLHLFAALVFAVLLVILWRRWPPSLALYATAALVVALGSRNLDSLERYGLATVPFVLAAADVTDNPVRERLVVIVASAGLVIASVLAFTGELVP
jgi:hypothetical protein